MAAAGNLLEDLMTDILSRVAVKSLLRFRVVRWHDYLEGQGYRQAEVYTLGMNSWRKVGSPDMNVDHWIHQAYLNGAIHWLGHQNKRSCGVRFDVSSEKPSESW
ncbi:hypothetical protein SCA6_019117 [Theobroma cacao]